MFTTEGVVFSSIGANVGNPFRVIRSTGTEALGILTKKQRMIAVTKRFIPMRCPLDSCQNAMEAIFTSKLGVE